AALGFHPHAPGRPSLAELVDRRAQFHHIARPSGEARRAGPPVSVSRIHAERPAVPARRRGEGSPTQECAPRAKPRAGDREQDERSRAQPLRTELRPAPPPNLPRDPEEAYGDVEDQQTSQRPHGEQRLPRPTLSDENAGERSAASEVV